MLEWCGRKDNIQIDIKFANCFLFYLLKEHLLTPNRIVAKWVLGWEKKTFYFFFLHIFIKKQTFFLFFLAVPLFCLQQQTLQKKRSFFLVVPSAKKVENKKRRKRLLNRGILKVPKTFLHIFVVRSNFSRGLSSMAKTGASEREFFKAFVSLTMVQEKKYL